MANRGTPFFRISWKTTKYTTRLVAGLSIDHRKPRMLSLYWTRSSLRVISKSNSRYRHMAVTRWRRLIFGETTVSCQFEGRDGGAEAGAGRSLPIVDIPRMVLGTGVAESAGTLNVMP